MTDHLRKAAEAATPGPWQQAPDGWRIFDTPRRGKSIKLLAAVAWNIATRTPSAKANAAYIAAANPKVILELLDRLAALEAENARLREALTWYANPEIYKPHPHGIAFDARDLSFRAKAELARLPTREEG